MVASLLFLPSLTLLLLHDVVMLLGPGRVSAMAQRWPTFSWPVRPSPRDAVLACREAAIWYPKRSRCLQRSFALTLLLRLCGHRSELVIGYRPTPMRSHAWVELDGIVMNDLQQYRTAYRPLARL